MENLIFVFIGFITIFLVLIIQKLYKKEIKDLSILLMQQEIANLRQEVSTNINNLTNQVQERLKETSEVLSQTNKTIGERLDSSTKIVSDIKLHLGELNEITKRMSNIELDIVNIFKSPKTRGGVGEFLLSSLLKDILPQSNFDLQYTFKNGARVDAVIKLRDGFVPVDAKFPLTNFKRIIESNNDEEKNRNRKQFIIDIKKHIDDISEKYIQENEKTLGFALMYIPSENVYYEIISDSFELYKYSTSKNVFMVSPNIFSLYLSTIAMGLSGMRIEENAKEIIVHLRGLVNDFKSINDDFFQIEKGLFNLSKKCEKIRGDFNRFGISLNRFDEAKEEKTLQHPLEISLINS